MASSEFRIRTKDGGEYEIRIFRHAQTGDIAFRLWHHVDFDRWESTASSMFFHPSKLSAIIAALEKLDEETEAEDNPQIQP